MKYNDTPVKYMLYPALIFLVVGMTLGTFLAFNTFVFPDYFSGEYIHFGRLRPVHVFSVAWLWLLSANIGLFYFLVPRLCGVPLWSPRLAYCSIAIWWFSLIVATFSYPFGTNFGWEYAELPNWVGWIPTKPLVTIAWIMVVINLFATIATRRYEKLYVSLWYVMGTLIWTTFTYLAGVYFINYVPGGISRVNVNFFYMHNLVGLIFTPMGLAIAYYFLPKLTNTPIYSHQLSLIGFWSIAFVYAWVGAHHMMHGPMPQWLQTVSIIFSIWLFIPVWTVITNLFGTLKGNWDKYTESAAVRFTIMGVLFYLMTCIQGPLQALRNVNEITSKTDWIIGHSHISLFATFSFFAFSGVYLAIPTITNKPLWSDRLADWHFSLNLWGIFPFIFTLSIAGFWQGMMWSTWAEGSTYAEYHRQLTELPFIETISRMHLSWILRAIGGLIILIGNILFVFNMYNTILLEPSYERRAHGTLKIEKSAILTIIGIILLFSTAVFVTLIAPRHVDSSWTTPSSAYQVQMYTVADPNFYISSTSTKGQSLEFVYHLKNDFNLLSFNENDTFRIVAPSELETYITRKDEPILRLTSRLLLLRHPQKNTGFNAEWAADNLRKKLQEEWELAHPNFENEGLTLPRFTILELFDPQREDAFARASTEGVLESYVDKNYLILDPPKQEYHKSSGVIFVKNPEEYRVLTDTYGKETGWRYDPKGNTLTSLDQLKDVPFGFRSREELIKQGEHLYAIEGCYYCHTDQTRTLVQDVVLNGSDSYPAPPSSANEYIFQHITFPGTRRIGPDISRVGVKRPSRDWHKGHFWSPKTASKGSIMPAFRHFFDDDPSGKEHGITLGIPNHQFEALYQYLMTKGTRITPPTEAWWLGKDPVQTKLIIEGKKTTKR